MPRHASEEEKRARLAALIHGLNQNPPWTDSKIAEKYPHLFRNEQAVETARRYHGFLKRPGRGPLRKEGEISPAIPRPGSTRRGPRQPKQ